MKSFKLMSVVFLSSMAFAVMAHAEKTGDRAGNGGDGLELTGPATQSFAPLNFVRIPLNNYCGDSLPVGAGCFLMGSPYSEVSVELRRYSRDEKLHEVVLEKPFEMGATTVTQAQWFEVMKTNPSTFCSKEACPTTHQLVQDASGSFTCLCPNNPVENVSYNDTQTYIEKLNARKDGYTYALPTEAEFEYSARAGTSTAYYFGSDASQLEAYAWLSTNSNGHTHEVAQKAANAFGLYDMEGNVWQWVADFYAEDDGVPTGCGVLIDPVGPAVGSLRLLRGGSYNDVAQNLRSAVRYIVYPDGHNPNVGLRLVRSTQ